MSYRVRTSRVFAATLALYDRLDSIDLPRHSTTGNVPEIHLARDPGWQGSDYVSVLLNDDPAVNEWRTLGPAGRGETIVIDVLIRTMVPDGESDRKKVERLAEVADAVQLVAYDVDNGRPAFIGFDGERQESRVAQVSFSVTQYESGPVGEALVQFVLTADI